MKRRNLWMLVTLWLVGCSVAETPVIDDTPNLVEPPTIEAAITYEETPPTPEPKITAQYPDTDTTHIPELSTTAPLSEAARITQAFLTPFTSLFFGLHSENPALSFVWNDSGWDTVSHSYFVDRDGNRLENVSFIRTLYDTGQSFSGGFAMPVYASRFHLFGESGSDEPVMIVLFFESGEFSGGGAVFYRLEAGVFEPIGSMLQYHWGGPGPDAPSFTPWMDNDQHHLLIQDELWGSIFYRINELNTFEAEVVYLPHWYAIVPYVIRPYGFDQPTRQFSLKEFEELLMDGDAWQWFPLIPSVPFQPLARLYELEEVLTLAIREEINP